MENDEDILKFLVDQEKNKRTQANRIKYKAYADRKIKEGYHVMIDHTGIFIHKKHK